MNKFKIFTILFLCVSLFGAHAQIDRSKQPQPGPAPKINLGQPDTFTLKNGLKVLVVENHKLPRVSATLIIDNKPHSEGNKEGVKALFSALMGTGTQNTSKDAFNERIDFLGARVGYGTSSASAASLSKFFPEVFGLMAEGLLMPKFTQEEFDAEKAKLIEGIKSSAKSAGAIASNVSSALVYGKNHPYGEFATEESVENVTLNDVKKYYQNYISPKNAYLVVVGDIKTKEVKKLVKKNFKSWQADTPPAAALPNLPTVQYTQVNFIDVPNAVQSELRIQNAIDLKMADEDYFPVLLANQILGGAFGSYLNMNLREEHGWTYGARTSTGSDKYASRFVASTSVRNAVTDSAIVESFKEFNRIKTEPVSFEDLNNAKSQFAGDFVMRLESPSTVANYALNIETNDLPEDFYVTFLEKINAVTPEDILRVANKYYKTDKMQIVVAGKGSEILESLENIHLNGKKVPVFYFDKEGNKVDRPVYKIALPEGVNVETVYNDYLKAIGGKEKLKDVKSLAMEGEGKIQGMTLNFNIKSTQKGEYARVVSMNGMTMSKEVFDGETGYVMAQGQKIDFTPEQIKDAKKSGGLFPELNVPADAKLTGIEMVDGKKAYVVQTTENTQDFYSVDTGLKIQSVTTAEQMGQTVSNTVGYGNYKEVNGVKIPHSMTMSMGPQNLDINMNNVTINKGVSSKDFE